MAAALDGGSSRERHQAAPNKPSDGMNWNSAPPGGFRLSPPAGRPTDWICAGETTEALNGRP